jgi:hypothetical protein
MRNVHYLTAPSASIDAMAAGNGSIAIHIKSIDDDVGCSQHDKVAVAASFDPSLGNKMSALRHGGPVHDVASWRIAIAAVSENKCLG